MCFYNYQTKICKDCDTTFETSTIRRRRCLKQNCSLNYTANWPAGVRIKEVVKKVYHPGCDCHFPLVI